MTLLIGICCKFATAGADLPKGDLRLQSAPTDLGSVIPLLNIFLIISAWASETKPVCL